MVYCRRCLYPRRVLELEETIGQRVRKERWAKGMSQGQLAREASLSLNAISALEQGGRVDPRSSTILSISRALGVPVATLLVEEEGPKAEAPNSSDSDQERRITDLGGWIEYIERRSQAWEQQAEMEQNPFLLDPRIAIQWDSEVSKE